MTRKTGWRLYFGVCLAVLIPLTSWIIWRSGTCVPCEGVVPLDRPGTYEFRSRWFSQEEYLASFLMGGVFPRTFDWYNKAEENLWHGSPPHVTISVRARNRERLRESSDITEAHKWIFSGSVFDVDVYKFLPLHGEPMMEHRVTLHVDRGSPAASKYRVTFRLTRVCEYEGLGHLILLALAIGPLAFAGIVMALVQLLTGRRRSA